MGNWEPRAILDTLKTCIKMRFKTLRTTREFALLLISCGVEDHVSSVDQLAQSFQIWPFSLQS